MLFARYVPLSIATLTIIMNVVLLIFGFIFIGKEFGAKTVYTAITKVDPSAFVTVYAVNEMRYIPKDKN